MRRYTYVLLSLCVFLPISTQATTAAAAVTTSASTTPPSIDCKSAIPPQVDFKTFNDTCRAEAIAKRASSGAARAQATVAAATAAMVSDSRTTVAGLNFANVPTWSDADILAQFATTRDVRYLTQSFPPIPNIQRRITWMFPDDGCYDRAEQVDVKAAQAGKARPYKLFAFGRAPYLRAFTDNTVSGMVEWGYHVVPVVKNSAGEPIVFDAALSPCRPLPYKVWLAMMVDDMSSYDNIAAGNGVALADSWAYMPYSLVSGEPSHSDESRYSLEGLFLESEWNRQILLGRDPNVVLESTPPWSGYNCLSTNIESQTATVAPSTNATVTATCPFATLAVGGGVQLGVQGMAVSKNARSGNGWQIVAKNNGSASTQVTASAVCLTGAPINASLSTITGNVVNINPNSYSTSSATCGNGQLISGGYVTTLGAGSSTVMRVYNDSRASSTSSTWQASAQNTTTTTKSITAYAYCLANSGFTFNQVSAPLSGSSLAFPFCSPKKTIGGGFSFPRTSAYNVMSMQHGVYGYMINLLPAPPDGDPNAFGYAECLAHP